MPLRLKIILWIVGIATALVGLFFAFVLVTFSGGVDDVFNRPGPYETDRQVIRAREKATPELRVKQDDLLARLADPSWQLPPADDRQTNKCRIGEHG